MTHISPARSLLPLVRSQPTPGARAATRASGGLATVVHGRLSATASRRIGALSPDDPDRRRKALRIYLESALLKEFGTSLGASAEFASMLDEVQQQMQRDDVLSASGRAAADWLLLRCRP